MSENTEKLIKEYVRYLKEIGFGQKDIDEELIPQSIKREKKNRR